MQPPIHIDVPGSEETPRRTPPVELSTLDDAVLAYSSEHGEPGMQRRASEGEHADPAPHPDGACGCAHANGDLPADVEIYTEVIFKGSRRAYFLNDAKLELAPSMHVLVEAEKGVDLGVVGLTGEQAYYKSRLRNKPCEDPLKRLVRPAAESDVSILAQHREQEGTAYDVCLEKIHKLKLPMKLVDVEFQFDRNRITFYFTADGRVDFRELVRELASEYRTRIELRQIGPRDEAKRMGGYGVCGRELCCSSFLGVFEPISTEMAKLQNLTLNPFKLAGQCGRLKCCLSYELQVYAELLKRFPPLDYRFKTPKGLAKIEKIDIFQDVIYVHYENPEGWERLSLAQVNAMIPAVVS